MRELAANETTGFEEVHGFWDRSYKLPNEHRNKFHHHKTCTLLVETKLALYKLTHSIDTCRKDSR